MVKNKKILVVGLANKYSIAAAISQSLSENGATLGFSYQNERFEKFIDEFSKETNGAFTEICDVAKDSDIKSLVKRAVDEWGEIDGLVHSVGFAPADQKVIAVARRGGGQIGHIRATAWLGDAQRNPFLTVEDWRGHLCLHPLRPSGPPQSATYGS